MQPRYCWAVCRCWHKAPILHVHRRKPLPQSRGARDGLPGPRLVDARGLRCLDAKPIVERGGAAPDVGSRVHVQPIHPRHRHRPRTDLCDGAVDGAAEFLIDLPRHLLHFRVADHGKHLLGIHRSHANLAALLVDHDIARQQQA